MYIFFQILHDMRKRNVNPLERTTEGQDPCLSSLTNSYLIKDSFLPPKDKETAQQRITGNHQLELYSSKLQEIISTTIIGLHSSLKLLIIHMSLTAQVWRKTTLTTQPKLPENIVHINNTLLSHSATNPQLQLYFRRMSATINAISSIEALLSEYKRIFVDIIQEGPSEPQKIMEMILEEHKLLIVTLAEEIGDLYEILKCRKEFSKTRPTLPNVQGHKICPQRSVGK